MTDTVDPSRAPRRFGLFWAVIYAVHLALVLYAVPPKVLFGDRPYAPPDYQTHYNQTTTLTEVVKEHGRFWAYDPHMLAGHPIGLIFDVDNKLHFLFTHGLTRLGVPTPVAFNLFTLLSCLLAPLSVWLAARLLRTGRRAELFALGMGVLLWHFDSSCRFSWAGGMISFGTVAHGSLLVLALFYRLLQGGSWRHFVPLMILLPLNLLTHVWSFAILVVPMIGLYIRHWNTLRTSHHIQVWGLAVLSITVNLYWLAPALRFFDLLATSGVVGQANPLYLISDWLEFLINPVNTGFIMPHTLFRYLAYCGVALVLWRWRKERDERLFVAGLTLGWLFGLAYVASMIPGLRETEPYRFVMPAVFMSGIIASPWLARVFSREYLGAMSRRARILLVVALVLLVPRVVSQIVYFIPELSPRMMVPPAVLSSARGGPNQTIPMEVRDPPFLAKTWRMRPVDDGLMNLARYFEREATREGRVLVQHWAVAEFMGWATDREILGGFPDRRMKHEAANLFHRVSKGILEGQELADYLVRYNVRYLVVSEIGPGLLKLESRRDLLQPLKLLPPHRIYLVRHKASFVARGSGKVRASLNRIEVTDARPDPGSQAMLLRYHHMSTLRCRPGCKVLKARIRNDEIGFITVVGQPTLPRRFVIENKY